MRKKPGFNLRDVCGEQIVVAEGKENIDFSNIISMNETSAFIWEALGDKEFDADMMASLLSPGKKIPFFIPSCSPVRFPATTSLV